MIAQWWFWSMRSEFSEARQWLGRVLRMTGAPQFPDLYAAVLTQPVHHAYLQSGAREARSAIDRALALARAQGKTPTLANALMVSGLVLAVEGDFGVAWSALEESVDLFRALHDRWGQALALMALGDTAYRKDDEATALALCAQALAGFHALGDLYFRGVCLAEIGSLRVKQGDWEGGLAGLRESLALARELGSKYEVAAVLLRLAATEQRRGQPVRAVQLCYAARNVYDSIGVRRSGADAAMEDCLARCRVALGQAAYAAARDVGHAMTLERAVDAALGGSPGP